MSDGGQSNAEIARQILELLPPLRSWVTARVQGVGADQGVSLRQFAALRSIQLGATSPGELARLWQVTPAVITGIIDRLEVRGLVRREVDPRDRRRLRLALTEAGLLASHELETALVSDLVAQLELATPQELAQLGRSLELLHRTFASLEAKAPALAEPSADAENPLWIEGDDGVDAVRDRDGDRVGERDLVGARD